MKLVALWLWTEQVFVISKQQVVPVHEVSTAVAQGAWMAQAVRQTLDPRRFPNALTVAIVRADERRKDGAVDRVGSLASLQVRNGVQPVLRLFRKRVHVQAKVFGPLVRVVEPFLLQSGRMVLF